MLSLQAMLVHITKPQVAFALLAGAVTPVLHYFDLQRRLLLICPT